MLWKRIRSCPSEIAEEVGFVITLLQIVPFPCIRLRHDSPWGSFGGISGKGGLHEMIISTIDTRILVPGRVSRSNSVDISCAQPWSDGLHRDEMIRKASEKEHCHPKPSHFSVRQTCPFDRWMSACVDRS